MTNILEAICNIIENPITEIKKYYSGRNQMNNMGEALETYVKDAFANTISEEKEIIKLEKYNQVFSWLGNQNNPPDIMIKGGDAIEVKKIQSANSDIALNSSYPKSYIKSNSNMIVQACRDCENWTEKDLIYCIGHTSDTEIKSLWLVYGSIYSANQEIYEIIKQKISNGINEIPNVEFSETKELGRANRIDPLGITNLRIRGMWHIQNPKKVFSYLNINQNDNLQIVAMIPLEKYNSFPKESRDKIESLSSNNLSLDNVKVKNPNNPVNLIDVKLIIFNKVQN